ncbi:hypothetical protein SAMN04487894_11063 [Niabella drilacis]|uniref:Natural product n=1 Tax=Niabella drilacis (strain DSM 25811 / CCM 8410 / CCUG 62505 / LMG 26954 / E90) TaxID=1285928 RepID=A0A1G6VKW6_NIADE|nr:hypothetical protein SAMN04487894_11063 [Niabella drilacis]
MKKLKLRLTESGTLEILTREQLKKILGGNGSGGSGGSGRDCPCGASCSHTVTVLGHTETFVGTCKSEMIDPDGNSVPGGPCFCSV